MSSEIYMLAQAVQEYEKPVVMFNEFMEKYLFMIVIAREDEIANGYYLL